MMKIVNMRQSGMFVVFNAGRLTTIDGCDHWGALDEVKTALSRNKIDVAERVLETMPRC